MAIRKIDLMHRLFGIADGKCGNCCHFVQGRYHDRILRKCEVYGLTHSEASDWAKRWQACGLFNKETTATNIIANVRSENRKNEPPQITVLDGQTGMEL